jgi:asparagine synthase (glutamine-hydrolysing)
MCGIAGMLRVTHRDAPWDLRLLDRMTDSLAHRGPDDRGTWHDGRVALGHRRLSVIDLSPAGRQPMGNEDGTVQLVFNGEIYNFRELRTSFDLDRRGHRFRSRTDSEVLIHLYEELGVKIAEHLNGMYAFALWDSRSGQLHLARDPFGVKPLFYCSDGETFRFASEIKALLIDPAVSRTLSIQALHDFLSLNYIPGTQTAFADVLEVPPGAWLTVDTTNGEITTHRFWNLARDDGARLGIAEATERSRDLIDQAVRRQLVADVPVGVMLSGGLDSSALVAFMSRQRNEPVHTYSVGFEDSSFNELPYARIVARHFGTVQREVIVTADHVRDMLPAYLRSIDEPYGDGSAIPTYYVCQLARDEVTVVLSGEGGDEAFAGYDTHAAYKACRWGAMIPRALRRALIEPIVYRLPVSHRKLSLEFKLKRFLGGLDLPPAAAHLWWRIVLSEQAKLAIYSDEVRQRGPLQPTVRFFDAIYRDNAPADPLKRLLAIDSSVFLPDDLMIKNDRMSMAHSLEARVPFTDPDLMRFLASVPADQLLPGLKKKNLMRRALHGLLPAIIINKKKVGLEMPYSSWLRSELKDLVGRYLSPEPVAASGLFRPEAIGRLVEEHQEGRVDHGRALWGLLNYMMWIELYDARL